MKEKEIKPWSGKEAIVIDGHFDNPKREWNGDKTKPLQNYIEEEVNMLIDEYYIKDKADGQEYCTSGDKHFYLINVKEAVKECLRKSLHRIAKITAEEIVPKKKDVVSEYVIGSEFSTPRIVRENGYNQALSDLQTKIKEFIK